MDGVFIYWLGWMAWVIITFLLPKTKTRLGLAVCLMLLLILMPYKVYLFGFSVSFAYLFLCACCCYVLRITSWYSLLYDGLVSCIVGSAFASLHLVMLYDPVINLVDARLMMSVIIFCMTFVTFSSWRKRFLISITGLLTGEWMYTMIVHKLFYSKVIGSMYFFDIVGLSLTISGCVAVIHYLLLKVASNVKEKKKPGIVEAS